MLKLLHIAVISHISKVMLKILQASLQQYMNHELPDVPAGFRKGRGTRDQIANILWIIKKAYLTYMQSTSWETLGWKKCKLESSLQGEISVTSDMQMTPPLGQKVKKN